MPDKRQTEAVGKKVKELIAYKFNRESLSPELTKWVEGLPLKLRRALGKAGLLSVGKMAALRPLVEHVDGTADAPGWRQSLMNSGNTAGHVDASCHRVLRVLDGCGFRYWSDIDRDRVESFLYDLRSDKSDGQGRAKRGVSIQTSNHHLAALRSFCHWMVTAGRASEFPLHGSKRLNAKVDRRHARRALDIEEVRWLLRTTSQGSTRRGMSGPDRAMLYKVAVETGLRAGGAGQLARSSFNLDGERPTVTVEAAYSKHRRQDELPIRPDTAADLRTFMGCKHPAAKVFAVPLRTAEVMKADLAAARTAWLNDAATPQQRKEREDTTFLCYADSAGRLADFHALRHTTGSWLAAAKVHPKMIQAIMRHSDINLTMSTYTHVFAGQGADAVAALPDLDAAPAGQSARATGTDSSKALPDAAGKGRARDQAQGRPSGRPNSLSRPEGTGAQAGSAPFSAVSVAFASPYAASDVGQYVSASVNEREGGRTGSDNALDSCKKEAVFKGNPALSQATEERIVLPCPPVC